MPAQLEPLGPDSSDEELFRALDPMIRAIVRRRLSVTLDADDSRRRNQDALDVYQKIWAVVFARLRSSREGGDPNPVREVMAYAASAAHSCCDEYIRMIHKDWWRLKNKLRYLLNRRPGLATWVLEGELWCGCVGWKTGSVAPANAAATRNLQSPAALEAFGYTPQMSAQGWDTLLEAIFSNLEGPIRLDDLVRAFATVEKVEDIPDQPFDEDKHVGVTRRSPEAAADATSVLPIVDPILRREQLKKCFDEILQMDRRHRIAYLLNMSDGKLEAFPELGVASVIQILSSLELTEQELGILLVELAQDDADRKLVQTLESRACDEAFWLLWKNLPLEDLLIAKLLGVGRQQIINFRRKALERLGRRMEDYR
jgi:hypothetical protein